MERFHAHIGALNSALQQASVASDAVGMHVPSHIFFSMIDHFVRIVSAQFHIGRGLVTVESGTRQHMLMHGMLNQFARSPIEDGSSHFTLAL